MMRAPALALLVASVILGVTVRAWSQIDTCTTPDDLERAQCQTQNRRHLDAIDTLERHLATNRTDARAECLLGVVLAAVNRFDETQVHLRFCSGLPPDPNLPGLEIGIREPEFLQAETPYGHARGKTRITVEWTRDEPALVEISLVSRTSDERIDFYRSTSNTRTQVMVWAESGLWTVETKWATSAVTRLDVDVADSPESLKLERPALQRDSVPSSTPRILGVVGRVDFAPMPVDAAGGALELGAGGWLFDALEPTLLWTLTPRMTGAWAGSGVFPTRGALRPGVVAGVPLYIARLGDHDPVLPTPLVGGHLAVALRYALPSSDTSFQVALGAEYYPALASDRFRGTLFVGSVGMRQAVF